MSRPAPVSAVFATLILVGLAAPAVASTSAPDPASSAPPSPTASPSPTATPSPTPSSTATPTPTPSSTATPTPSPTPTASPTPDPTGTLRVASRTVPRNQVVTFRYRVDHADPQNWIGVWRAGEGPVDQVEADPTLVWAYVAKSSGTLSLPTDGLEPGHYTAFGLEDDGYRWFATPVAFDVIADNRPPHFPTESIPLRNANAWSPYAADLSGLVRGERSGLTFRKVSGPEWIRVGASGAVRGTPPGYAAGRTASAQIEARTSSGKAARATIRIDVRRAGAQTVRNLRTMTWNVWLGGSQVSDHLEKEMRFVLDQDIDVIGIQESNGTAAKELGEALGWDYYQAGDDVGIVSKYRIVSRSMLTGEDDPPAARATIRLDERRRTDVTIWDTHLAFNPYGPYDACFGHLPVDQLLAKEASSGRTGQITAAVEAMERDLRRSDSVPVLLTGDFNGVSHLDWSRRTDRCGYTDGVPWPTSTVPTDAGLVDTYRRVHPDPLADPGLTWSPIYKTFTGGYGYDSFAGQPEPQDRIDFVYAKGPWRVTDSRTAVAGDPRLEPDQVLNEWTSDHRAVITDFRVR